MCSIAIGILARDEANPTTLRPDTRPARHPPAPHGCAPPARQHRTRSLLLATRRHSLNPQLRGWTIPANLPIALLTAILLSHERKPVQTRPASSLGFASWLQQPFSRRSPFCRRLFSEQLFSSPVSSSALSSCSRSSSTLWAAFWFSFW